MIEPFCEKNMSNKSAPPLQSLFERVLDQLPDLILIKGPNSKIVWANQAFCRVYGMGNDQLRDLIDSPVAEPDHTQQYIMDDAWVWNNAKPLVIDCEPITTFEGAIRKYKTLKFPIFDDDGNVVFTAGISSDITETVESEQKLEASSKMAALGEMAGGIAHEINNPLAVISAKVRQVRRMFQPEKPLDAEKVLESLTVLDDFTQRIARIVAGLRSFSRDGTHDPFERCELKEIVEQTLILCRVSADAKGIDLDVNIDDKVVLNCRPVQISQVLLNLISNAMDAVEHETRKWIKISTEVSAGSVYIRIHDSGRGVPDEIANKIMQPFFTTKDVGKGTGLGLSLSQGMIKAHNGELRLDRTVSKSCFKITLPLS